MYKKYLNNARECTQNLCISGTEYMYLNGSPTIHEGDEDRYNVSTWAGFQQVNGQYNSFVLSDGVVFNVQGYMSTSCTATNGIYKTGTNNQCVIFLVDLNGARKPNAIGRDAFMFVLKEDVLYPAGCDNNSASCNKTSHGCSCACKVIKEGEMNYI